MTDTGKLSSEGKRALEAPGEGVRSGRDGGSGGGDCRSCVHSWQAFVN